MYTSSTQNMSLDAGLDLRIIPPSWNSFYNLSQRKKNFYFPDDPLNSWQGCPSAGCWYFRFQFLTKTSATLAFHLFVMAEETSFKFSFIFWNWETFTKWNYFAEAGTTPLSSKRLIMNIGIKFRCSVESVFGMRTIQKNINAGV